MATTKKLLTQIRRQRVADRVLGKLESRRLMTVFEAKMPLESRRLDEFNDAVDAYLDAVDALTQTTVKIPKLIDRGIELCDDDEDGRWRNRDLPDHQAFVEQGNHEAVNEHIDLRIDDAATGIREIVPTNPDYYRFHWASGAYEADESRVVPRIRRRMDAGHFRELCYQSGGRNQALYERRSIDFDAAQHVRPEWLAEKIDIEWPDAVTLAEFLRKMRFNRQMTLKLIFGHMAHPQPEEKPKVGCHRPKGGLQVLNAEQLKFWIGEFMAIAEQLPELPEDEQMLERSLEDHRQHYFDESNYLDFDGPLAQINWIEREAVESFQASQLAHHGDIERLIELGFNVDPPEPTEEDRRFQWLFETTRYLSFDSNPYSSFPLHYGEDAIGWDLVLEIKSADMDKLKEIQSRMFPVKGYRSWQPAEYRHFTYGQRTSFWAYLNARKQQIAAEYRGKLTRHSLQVIEEVKKLGASRTTKAFIMAYRNGGKFETDEAYYEFDSVPRPSPEEMYVIWGAYRELQP